MYLVRPISKPQCSFLGPFLQFEALDMGIFTFILSGLLKVHGQGSSLSLGCLLLCFADAQQERAKGYCTNM